MGEMIHKPDANPVLFALANLLFACGGYLWMGQTKKGIIAAIIAIILVPCGFIVGIWIWYGIVVYDAYLLGQKLQQGESIGQNENGLEFLNAIFKD